ncbi:MAG: hypothetical protein NC930_00230 [Candidatus Omnitrophica bacterium]|nr:hypothetical protein [Candidatus Omnitrophota bacterium]
MGSGAGVQHLNGWRICLFLIWVNGVALFAPASTVGLSSSGEKTSVETSSVKEQMIKEPLPREMEIREIIQSLTYSAIPALLRPEVKLGIHPADRVWSLANYRKYDSEGNVMLEEGKYGICTELVRYVYRRIKGLYPPGYTIEYVRVKEPCFFSQENTIHYILRVQDPALNTYIIDPTFHRYRRLEDAADYTILESRNFLVLPPHLVFSLNTGIPILIRNDYLIDLTVVMDTAAKRLNRRNFFLVLAAVPKFHTDQAVQLLILKRSGRKSWRYEDRKEAERIIGPSDYYKIRKRMLEWFREI